MKIKWRVFVDKCEPIPWGYGVGSRPYNMLGIYCYPMPFHLLVQAYRWFYGWMRGWYPDRWKEQIFWQFISDQKDLGYQAGFKMGYREGVEKTIRLLLMNKEKTPHELVDWIKENCPTLYLEWMQYNFRLECRKEENDNSA